MTGKRKTVLKRRLSAALCLLLVFSLVLGGCGKKKSKKKSADTRQASFESDYKTYYQKNHKNDFKPPAGMAEGLAVLSADQEDTPDFYTTDKADLLINDSTGEVLDSYHCFRKAYPASITKIMTALLVLENGNLDDEITLTHNTVIVDEGAVMSTLTRGDTVTVDAVLHTLLIKSANDCAVILAEYIAGDEQSFVEMMNKRAWELGATHTHFVTTNGLHRDDHYTTAYDLYLIFKKVVEYDTFVDIVSSKDYTLTYRNSAGSVINEYMETTNYYLLNEYPVPAGLTMYGGKTGTTSAAGSCLILMTENEAGDRFFSVVLGARSKPDLYDSMTRLLEKIPK